MTTKMTTKVPIDVGMIARAVAGVRYTLTGKAPEWFGPSDPLPPMAQEQAVGRKFDYPVAANIQFKPRANEPISFAQMRALADGYDLLRLVIETRKDQLAKMVWKISLKDSDATPDDRCQQVQDFLAFPDQEHNFQTWIRMVLEDMFVLDAATVYPRKTKGGAPFAFELIDGATIKRVIDSTGRTPFPPEPAYQQVLKGVPAVDYSRDELVYFPRNLRTHKIYGYSQVEQIIMTVNIALRRQMNQLSYYTEGNTPNLIFGTPETWSPDQIKAFQSFWDSINSGQSKHSAKFVPGGVTPIDTKPQILKDEFDEWLARVVCFAFSISPTPFIKSMNRATAESSQESALQEGLQPLMQWVEDLMNLLIWKYFGYKDLCFSWQTSDELAPEILATIADKKLRNATLTINESRSADGLDPVDGGDELMIYTAMGAVLLKDIINPPEPITLDVPPAPEESVVKIQKKKSAAVIKATEKLTRIIKRFLRSQASDLANQIKSGIDKITKAENPDVDKILAELDFAGWLVLTDDVEPVLKRIAEDGSKAALAQVKISDEDITSQASENAILFAKNRAAEMVGMKWDGEELIENPKAKWAITEGTRELLRSLVSDSIEEGWSSKRLADEVGNSTAFSDDRAELIGRTEIARASSEGNMIGWRASGVVEKKEWVPDVGACEICQENADDGEIELNEMFSSGDDSPPAHPRCECAVAPVVADLNNSEEE